MVTSKTHQGPDLLTICPRRSPHVLIAFPSQSNAVRGERAHLTGEKTELRVQQSLSKGLPWGQKREWSSPELQSPHRDLDPGFPLPLRIS